VSEGAIVIDVGINRGATASCAATSTSSRRVSARRGLRRCRVASGPMTIATLLANTLRATELQETGA
jgi:5,10-methylene-tetrahydrofolate dehydrogenase/methenyl tetrahydrofolate cyclohydrolase